MLITARRAGAMVALTLALCDDHLRADDRQAFSLTRRRAQGHCGREGGCDARQCAGRRDRRRGRRREPDGARAARWHVCRGRQHFDRQSPHGSAVQEAHPRLRGADQQEPNRDDRVERLHATAGRGADRRSAATSSAASASAGRRRHSRTRNWPWQGLPLFANDCDVRSSSDDRHGASQGAGLLCGRGQSAGGVLERDAAHRDRELQDSCEPPRARRPGGEFTLGTQTSCTCSTARQRWSQAGSVENGKTDRTGRAAWRHNLGGDTRTLEQGGRRHHSERRAPPVQGCDAPFLYYVVKVTAAKGQS